jgi:hypothetical protein
VDVVALGRRKVVVGLMASGYVIAWDDPALAGLGNDPAIAAFTDRVAAAAVQTMKFLTPVSPVGPLHRSGNLRSSVHAFRQVNGDVLVGPTADYGEYVNDGTRPHIIRSRGPWPLRNRETGQVFGQVVHHPGTRPVHFIERTADSFEGRRYSL